LIVFSSGFASKKTALAFKISGTPECIVTVSVAFSGIELN
jgi:hypothetical protein